MIFEVGVRDGLQNESTPVLSDDKYWFASELAAAGIKDLELGAFVRSDKVPQMADTEALYARVKQDAPRWKGVRLWSLVANQRGLERAQAAGASRIALFTAATDGFATRNIGMTVAESLKGFAVICKSARGLKIRGYVSTAFGCPFEGPVAAKKALKVIEKLADLGVEQVSIGDTIGVARPKGVEAVMKPALRMLGPKRVAAHFHDTRGTALANALRALDLGVKTLDSSAGGLGGCPFAPGATGNLATEDLVYLLHGQGIKTGVDLSRLCETSLEMARRMKRPLSSRYLQAYVNSGRAQTRWI